MSASAILVLTVDYCWKIKLEANLKSESKIRSHCVLQMITLTTEWKARCNLWLDCVNWNGGTGFCFRSSHIHLAAKLECCTVQDVPGKHHATNKTHIVLTVTSEIRGSFSIQAKISGCISIFFLKNVESWPVQSVKQLFGMSVYCMSFFLYVLWMYFFFFLQFLYLTSYCFLMFLCLQIKVAKALNAISSIIVTSILWQLS